MTRKIILPNLLVLILFAIVTGTISHSATVMKEQEVVPRQRCVIIDAGHGGIDGGATSISGILESRLNLEISLRLRDLCQLLGLNTVMIRNDDRSVHTEEGSIAQIKVSDLKNRAHIVNCHPDSILVSIHQNYFSDGRYGGAQVFYAGTPGSEELAKNMQLALLQNLYPSSNRKAKKASGIYLLEQIQRTGILIECGFLSNYEDEQRLVDPMYQKKLCAIIACTLSTGINDINVS